ncbi:iron-sulfur cluster-binding protein, Rieske family [Gemmata obscuriglobus]|uniref:Iron-sulfur cluster-binding protein, Rieske family n=2 Tax=Gemmata obscuriglobus TaxID=114 RepID=A0A2Z3H0B7_9BACT|nr:iron-sulfur cluster-binding protein, Rieske family [Gemmata obscuriglobus]
MHARTANDRLKGILAEGTWMGMLDHWQPVLLSRRLRRDPVGVVVANQPVALFRTSGGEVAALSDVCPHRRLKLSVGKVVGDRLQCKYHGWTFDDCGNGESPAAPKLTACTASYDAREAHGLVWIKSRTSAPPFPDVTAPGFYPICTLEHTVPAPLELAVDNFNEIEHSATVHDTFGYDLDRLSEVKVAFESTDDMVKVTNAGPTKTLNRAFAWLLGIRKGDTFHDHWTTRFSPVHSVFDHWWTSPDGAREAMVRWRLYIFFVPQDDKTTRVFSVTFAKSRYPGPAGGLRLFRWLLRREIDREVRSDVSMLYHMADYGTGIEGLKLSRFDKVLGLTRDRIARIYRGAPAGRVTLV